MISLKIHCFFGGEARLAWPAALRVLSSQRLLARQNDRDTGDTVRLEVPSSAPGNEDTAGESLFV